MCPAEDTAQSQAAPPQEELARLKAEHASLESTAIGPSTAYTG